MVLDDNGTLTEYGRLNVKEAKYVNYKLVLPYAHKWYVFIITFRIKISLFILYNMFNASIHRYDLRIYSKVSIAEDIPEMWTCKQIMVNTAKAIPIKTPKTAPGSFYQNLKKEYLNIFWKGVESKYYSGSNYSVLIEDEK